MIVIFPSSVLFGVDYFICYICNDLVLLTIDVLVVVNCTCRESKAFYFILIYF